MALGVTTTIIKGCKFGNADTAATLPVRTLTTFYNVDLNLKKQHSIYTYPELYNIILKVTITKVSA